MPVNILSWNSQSLSNKMFELKNFILNQPQQFQTKIILIQETWLNSNSKNISIPGFDCIRADRPRDNSNHRGPNSHSQCPHGGVLIFISNKLDYRQISLPTFEAIEAVAIEIKVGAFSFKIGSIYAPTCKQSVFKKDLNLLLSLRGPFILGGDFNAKHISWNNKINNHRGIALDTFCVNNQVDIDYPDMPTLFPDNNKSELSVVDIFLSKGLRGISKPKPLSLNIFGSDHRPVESSLAIGHEAPKPERVMDFKLADWKRHKDSLITSLRPHQSAVLDSSGKIEESLAIIQEAFEAAAKLAIPMKKMSLYRYPFSQEVSDAIKIRNRLRNEARLNPNNSNIRWQVNAWNRKIKSLLTDQRSKSWKEKLATLNTEDLSLYSFTRNLKRKFAPYPPLKPSANTLLEDCAYTSSQKAELIANTFLRVHQLSTDPSPHDQKVKASIDWLSNQPVSFPREDLITVNQTRDQLLGLKVRKSPGHDLIANRFLKNAPDVLISILTNIFNACLSIGYFPKPWKIGKIIALPKPGKDPSHSSSYRPITLLSNIGKVAEKLVLEKLKWHEEDHSILKNHQFGFRSSHSTTHQVLRIVEMVSSRFNENKTTAMVLIDQEKAFDKVWHEALIHKLVEYKFPVYQTKIVQSYLHNRMSYVSLGGESSPQFKVPAGVPQGSVLSPFLYNIHMNDVEPPDNCELASFADDIAFISSIENHDLPTLVERMENGLKEVQSHLVNWKLKINETKTEAILFTKSPKMSKLGASNKIIVSGTALEWKDQVKYLGVILDKKLLLDKNINHNIGKARKAMSVLYSLLKRSSQVNLSGKITLYRSYIRPILTYASPVFAHIAKTHKNRLQVQQNRALRMVLNAPLRTRIKRLHDRTNIPLIDDYTKKLNQSFFKRCDSSKNNLIRSLGTNKFSALPNRPKHRVPKKSLG